MTNPNSQPDFSDPDIINAILSSHPDLSGPSINFMVLSAEANEDAVRFAQCEAEVFAFVKQYMPEVEQLQLLVLANDAETPTLPDLIAELAISRNAVMDDPLLLEQDRTEILDQLACTLELASAVSDIAAKLAYPDSETTTNIKQCIENGEYLTDDEKAVLLHACDALLTGE